MKRKVSQEKIKELILLMPLPLYKPKESYDLSELSCLTENNSASNGVNKQRRPFNSNGFCILHPAIQLAKKDKSGDWEVARAVCPQCCSQSAVLACREKMTSSSLDRHNKLALEVSLVGKEVTTDDSIHTQPLTEAFSSPYFPSGNRKFAVQALDIQKSADIMTGPDEPYIAHKSRSRPGRLTIESEVTVKHKNRGPAEVRRDGGLARSRSRSCKRAERKDPPLCKVEENGQKIYGC